MSSNRESITAIDKLRHQDRGGRLVVCSEELLEGNPQTVQPAFKCLSTSFQAIGSIIPTVLSPPGVSSVGFTASR